ncbi:hypothetical protein [Echinicola shivajiensis]|uniref:hypothetical protein n=1 Tax=Echinicola shivajiensis TaxID=1035916 RepID=UPI001BFC000B|nr:hypothetical protein [Echinicola shivajiensis]
MRIKFWPKQSTIPAIKLNHRYGADMTFSFQTDSRLTTSIYAVEAFGFKNNFRIGAFQSNLVNQIESGISEAEATGLIRHDIYFGTDMWKNPVTGVVEVVPDYYDSEWTTLGASYFVNAIEGQPKATRYPNNGQQMYDMSNGAYGYDFSNDVAGTSNLYEYKGVVEIQKNWIKGLTGRNVSSGSYRNGRRETSGLNYPNFLGVRNSNAGPALANGDADTYYGSGLGYKGDSRSFREYFIDYPSTTRWWDYWNTFYVPPMPKADAIDYLEQEIGKTLVNNGWFRDFTHFHSAYSFGNLESLDEFMQIVKTSVGADFAWYCSNGEALEYMYLRELCNRVTAQEKDGKVTVILDVDDDFKDMMVDGISLATPLDGINTPLSIQVDLSGTSLSGKSIITTNGKPISLGSDNYIVEVPFKSAVEGFAALVIEEDLEGIGYLDFTPPVITTTIDGEFIEISTDQLTKCAVFQAPLGGELKDVQIYNRSNKLGTIHNFHVESGYEYWVGAINEAGQSSLLKI